MAKEVELESWCKNYSSTEVIINERLLSNVDGKATSQTGDWDYLK